MTAYQREDYNKQTGLLRDGEPMEQEIFVTLHEAALHVKNRWPKTDQAKARFQISGKNYGYSWADIEPHVE
jgi:hypothetical protein